MVIIMFMSLMPVVTHAITSGTCGDNLTWTLDDDGTLTISGTGGMDNSTYRDWYGIFENVERVEVGSGVMSYKSPSFNYFPNLKEISVDTDNPYFTSINGVLFDKAEKKLYAYPMGNDGAEYYVPYTVETIEKYAFSFVHFPEYTSYLKDIYISKNVITIDPFAFDNVYVNLWVDDDNTVFSSVDGVLYNKSKTKLIKYSKKDLSYDVLYGTEIIDDYAFYCWEEYVGDWDDIFDVHLPDTVKTIGNRAFSGRTLSLNIPPYIESIGDYAFEGSSDMQLGLIGGEVVLPETLQYLGEGAFYKSGIKSLVIPGSIKKVPEYLCYDAKSLSYIELKEGIEEIGNNAFDACSFYVMDKIIVRLPDSLTTINAYSLTIDAEWEPLEIFLPKNVSNISSTAFNYPEFSVASDNPYFSAVDGVLYNKDQSELINIGCTWYIDEFKIRDSVKKIAENAFRYSHLNTIEIPTSVKEIASGAFIANVDDIYYKGSEEQWNEIDIGSNNPGLNNATIHYNSRIPVSRGNITIEARDAVTGQLLPNASVSVVTSDKPWDLETGGSTLHLDNVPFPLKEVIITSTASYEMIKEYDVEYPESGTLVYYLSKYGDIVKTDNITLSESEININIGEKRKITAAVTPANATYKNVKWSSSNPNVVSIDLFGNIKGIKTGTATITAKTGRYGEYSAQCQVKVFKDVDYFNYRYNFPHVSESFGYSNSFRFPMERYLQAGMSQALATLYWMTDSWNGNCFGMSASSILFYKNYLQEENYNANVHVPVDFDKPDDDEKLLSADAGEIKLRHMIEVMQISHKLSNCVGEIFNAEKIAAELDKGNPVLLGLRSTTAGHAVVIYRYEKNDNEYTFHIYDCSHFVTSLVYKNNSEWHFEYDNPKYDWKPYYYCKYDTMKSVCDKICNDNHNNAISLFSDEEASNEIFVIRQAENLRLKNSTNDTLTITDGELITDVENAKLTLSSYLAETPRYMLTLPQDEYIITGSKAEDAETVIVNDDMSVTVNSVSDSPISISDDIRNITVECGKGKAYNIAFETYENENLYDKITLSGIASEETVNVIYNGNEITINGAATLTAVTQTGDASVTASADALSDKTDVRVISDDTGLYIASVDNELIDKIQLPERQQTAVPDYDLASGEYTEAQWLSFVKDDDTMIYYTTDGSDPVENGILYTMPIEINHSMNLRAVAKKHGCEYSEIVDLYYVLPTVCAPAVDIPGGIYNSVQTVNISDVDGDAEIYYTLDGSDPSNGCDLYNTALVLTGDTTIKAVAKKDGCISAVIDAEYIINPDEDFYVINDLIDQNGDVISGDNIGGLTEITAVLQKLTNSYNAAASLVFYDEQENILKTVNSTIALPEDINIIKFSVDSVPENAFDVRVESGNTGSEEATPLPADTQGTLLQSLGDYADKIEIRSEINDDEMLLTIKSVNDSMELSDLGAKLILAEYDNDGSLTSVRQFDDTSINDGVLTINAGLPQSNSYKFMLWDEKQCPLTNVITQVK
ncbi:MAG: leucine-rich repeat protein [Candidatus Ornithomonoglobus sp.]